MRYVSKALLGMSLIAALNVGCGDDDDSDGAQGTRNDAGADASLDASLRSDGSTNIDATTNNNGADAAAALSESQVVGLALAINDGEIQAGQVAATKATSQAVKDYASMMVTMHTAAVQRAGALGIPPAESTFSAEIKSVAQMLLQTLQTTPAGAEFDSGYVTSQVMMHKTALNAFDTLLIPNATTPALKAELTRSRGEVQTHLTEAQALNADGG